MFSAFDIVAALDINSCGWSLSLPALLTKITICLRCSTEKERVCEGRGLDYWGGARETAAFSITCPCFPSSFVIVLCLRTCLRFHLQKHTPSKLNQFLQHFIFSHPLTSLFILFFQTSSLLSSSSRTRTHTPFLTPTQTHSHTGTSITSPTHSVPNSLVAMAV